MSEILSVEKDRLHTLIRKHLDSPASRSQNFDELIVEAVGDYLSELMEQGFIPHPQLDLVEEVLMEESWDILRKITYGALSLAEYRRDRPKRERKKATC